jgi:hypothetical protein
LVRHHAINRGIGNRRAEMRVSPLMTKTLVLLAGILLCATSSHSDELHKQDFDWSLLTGTWAESTEHQFGCRSGNVHFRFEVTQDKKRLTFKLDRKWKIGSGAELEEYSASILEQAPNVLVIRYGPELADLSDEMREWEMRFIGPGTYRWRSTAWRPGQYNAVIGVKCKPQ